MIRHGHTIYSLNTYFCYIFESLTFFYWKEYFFLVSKNMSFVRLRVPDWLYFWIIFFTYLVVEINNVDYTSKIIWKISWFFLIHQRRDLEWTLAYRDYKHTRLNVIFDFWANLLEKATLEKSYLVVLFLYHEKKSHYISAIQKLLMISCIQRESEYSSILVWRGRMCCFFLWCGYESSSILNIKSIQSRTRRSCLLASRPLLSSCINTLDRSKHFSYFCYYSIFNHKLVYK